MGWNSSANIIASINFNNWKISSGSSFYPFSHGTKMIIAGQRGHQYSNEQSAYTSHFRIILKRSRRLPVNLHDPKLSSAILPHYDPLARTLPDFTAFCDPAFLLCTKYFMLICCLPIHICTAYILPKSTLLTRYMLSQHFIYRRTTAKSFPPFFHIWGIKKYHYSPATIILQSLNH